MDKRIAVAAISSRLFHRHSMLIYGIGILSLFSATYAYACTCVSKTAIEEAFEASGFVAICRVIEAIDDQVVDSSTGSSCAYEFRKGRKYLVYASGKAGTISSTYCDRTMPLSKVKKQELKKLKKLSDNQ